MQVGEGQPEFFCLFSRNIRSAIVFLKRLTCSVCPYQQANITCLGDVIAALLGVRLLR